MVVRKLLNDMSHFRIQVSTMQFIHSDFETLEVKWFILILSLEVHWSIQYLQKIPRKNYRVSNSQCPITRHN